MSSSSRKILILSLARPGRPPGRLYLTIIITLLRWLGFKFTTVSQALASSYGRYACLTVDANERQQLGRLKVLLDHHELPATVFVATGELGRAGGPTWKQLRLLLERGWEVGTRGHATVNLTEHSYREQRRLVSRARSLFVSHLGASPRVFAYPFGAYDATTVSCLKDEGFAAGVTLRRGLNNGEAERDPFGLRRLALESHVFRDGLAVLSTALRKPAAAPQGQSSRIAAEREHARSGAAL